MAGYSVTTSSDRVLPVGQLDDIMEEINMTAYWKAVLPKDIQQTKDLEKLPVHLLGDTVLQQLDRFLRTLKRQELIDYIDFKIAEDMINYLTSDISDLQQSFQTDVYGAAQDDHPQMDTVTVLTCIEESVKIFDEVASAMYIERFFQQSTLDEVSAIANNVRASFLKMLDSDSWIDANTREQAKRKATAMKKYVGFNPQIFNQTRVTQTYAELYFRPNSSSYKIESELAKFIVNSNYKTLLEENGAEGFDFLVSTVNAYYSPNYNTIAILAGILQAPFFNISQSRAQNYGAIGTIVGHEMTHGSKFDAQGNKYNWWDKGTLANFNTKSECFIEEYGKQKVEGLNLKVNGLKTLGENIADNGGFRAAFLAFQELISKGQAGNRPSAASLQKYTPTQIFFMGFAFNWCGSSRPEYLFAETPGDVHSPNRNRVNTVLSNQPEFAANFNCPPTSPMVAKQKCQVW
ncbi:unnamed protein product, partial [Mesorhabditis spiculigera]